MHEESDLLSAAKVMFSLVTAAPAGAVIVGFGNAAVTLVHLPEAVWKAYRALIKTPLVGPVIKTSVAVVLPIGIVATPPTALLASTIVGLGYGFYKGMDYHDEKGPRGPLNGIAKCLDLVRTFNKDMVEEGFFCWLEEVWKKPLKEGDKPFDVPIIDGLRGIVSSVVVAPFEAIGLTAVVLRHWPHLVYRMFRAIWIWPESLLMLTFSAALSILGTGAAILIVPLTPAVTLAYGLGDSCVEGYRHGIHSAFKKGFERIRGLNGALRETFNK